MGTKSSSITLIYTDKTQRFLCNNVFLFPSICTDNNTWNNITWNRTSDSIKDHRNEHVCGHEVDASGSCMSTARKRTPMAGSLGDIVIIFAAKYAQIFPLA